MKKTAILALLAVSAIAQQPNVAPFKTKSATITTLSSSTANVSNANGIINPASGTAPYTADPTGVLDSTAAIQAALDAAGTSTVELPAGTFLIGSTKTPLYLKNKRLRGQGQGATILKAANTGIQAAITTWTCAATTGTCASGTGPYTLTINLATQIFQALAGSDSFCSVSGGTCQLVTIFGWKPDTGAQFGVFGGGLNNVQVGFNFPVLPYPGYLSATSFTLQVTTSPGSNSGSGGTFVIPFKAIQTYDARSFAQSTKYEVDNLTLDGNCNSCNSSAAGWNDDMLAIDARSAPVGGLVTQGYIHDVTFQNVAANAIEVAATDGIVIDKVTCNMVGINCIDGQDNSDLTITNLKVTNLGFLFQGSGTFHSQGINFRFASTGYHDILIDNLSVAPNGTTNNYPFGIQGFQNGPSIDTSHLAFHGFTVKSYTYIEACLPSGGPVSVFADNLLIDGIYSDSHNCSTMPQNGTGFIEIGGSNNHITNGTNVRVAWAGIRTDMTHARNIEVDHLNWNLWFINLFQVSGGQGGIATPCEIDHVSFHDSRAVYTSDYSTPLTDVIAGIGYGEGSARCAIIGVDIHDIYVVRQGGGAASLGAFGFLGVGNGTLNHTDWHFHSNRILGWPKYIVAQCNSIGDSALLGTKVFNLFLDHEFTDLAPANLVQNNTGGPCPNNWNAPQLYQTMQAAGTWYDYDLQGVTGTITGVASSCVTGTVANAQFLKGASVKATRTDGALLQTGNSVTGAVLANGTATVNVCSGTTLEPAGTYNIQVSNPL